MASAVALAARADRSARFKPAGRVAAVHLFDPLGHRLLLLGVGARLGRARDEWEVTPAGPGVVPVTRASGRSISIVHRHIKNNRLANVGWMRAFSVASTCEPARRHYRQRRDHGDRHAAATYSTTPRTALLLMTSERPCGRCLLLPSVGEAYRQIGTAAWTFTGHAVRCRIGLRAIGSTRRLTPSPKQGR